MTLVAPTPRPYDQQRHTAELMAAGPAAIDRMSWTADRLGELQQRRLRALLAHAAEHSPFHRERLGGIDPREVTLEALPSLPTMTKPEMLDHFDEVLTVTGLSRTAVDEHVAAAPTEMRYLGGRYVVMASGGSSGTRGVFVYDAPEFTEYVLSITRGTMATLELMGVTPESPLPGAIVAGGATVHGSAAVAALAGGVGGPVALTSVPATLALPAIVQRLNELAPLLLVAYPSILVQLAAERAAGRLQIAPLSVGATSEALGDRDRAAIETAFGMPVTNTFGCSEGLCGVAPPGESAIVFATDSCIVELVDHQHQPVAPGTVADKVLVTNLHNHTQPLIRYELTDRFVEVPGPHPDGRLRAVVDGRHDEPFCYDGGIVVHPLAVRSTMVKDPSVYEYQVRQRADGIDVDVVAAGGFDAAALRDSLRVALTGAGLAEPAVEVRPVPGLPRDRATGKPRRFVGLERPLQTNGQG
jgi:phenylacetate-coenzyme A ligase PaaK-like adenylate-forming protein